MQTIYVHFSWSSLVTFSNLKTKPKGNILKTLSSFSPNIGLPNSFTLSQPQSCATAPFKKITIIFTVLPLHVRRIHMQKRMLKSSLNTNCTGCNPLLCIVLFFKALYCSFVLIILAQIDKRLRIFLCIKAYGKYTSTYTKMLTDFSGQI